jgi:Tfp pilus assembly protein PilZ
MKKKPLSISLIALGYVIAPFANIVQMAWVNQWPVFGPRGMIERMYAWEWFILATFFVVAYGIWRVARWGFVLFLVQTSYLILHNTYMFFKNPAYSVYIVLLFHFLNLGLVGFFLQKHIMSPYFNPSLKWWERNPRYRVNLAAIIKVGEENIETKLLDLSANGCFVAHNPIVHLGDIIWVTIQLSEQRIHLPGKVMWLKYDEPHGFGLLFMGLQPDDKKTLKKMIDYLNHSVEDGLKKNLSIGDKSA